MNGRRVLSRSLALGLIGLAGVWGWSRTGERFDHLEHANLFPTCTGCHRVDADRVTFPPPEQCVRCHDGETEERVEYAPPGSPPSNLEFNHREVLRAIAREGETVSCEDCHTSAGAPRMAVERAVVAGCLECHAPEAEHHIDAPCAECHVPLADARGLAPADIEAFPTPADHEVSDFLLEHGEAARKETVRCTVCHARELCSSCHVNAPELEPIQRLPRDPRVAALVATREPEYPVPESHRRADWLETHGERATGDISRCSTCHARDSCRSCHTSPLPPIRALPEAPADRGDQRRREELTGAERPRLPPQGEDRPAVAERSETQEAGERVQERGPGVRLDRRAPPSHTSGFLENHRALAATRTRQCEICHTRDECASCHTGSEALARDGREATGYHPQNFLQRHAAAAFGRGTECSTCHNPEAFCRDCHAGSGLGARGRIDTGFHDESPAWVFGHGAAARQGLESCATCHSQRDCLSCHSAAGGRRVNPHGPGFDADRLRSKNPGLCLTCHFRSILER